LFAKHRARITLADEAMQFRPQVPFVFVPLSLTGARKWLAGTTSCPNRPIVWPSCESQGERPAEYAAEKVRLDEPLHIIGLHLFNGTFIYLAVRHNAGGDQVFHPLADDLV